MNSPNLCACSLVPFHHFHRRKETPLPYDLVLSRPDGLLNEVEVLAAPARLGHVEAANLEEVRLVDADHAWGGRASEGTDSRK